MYSGVPIWRDWSFCRPLKNGNSTPLPSLQKNNVTPTLSWLRIFDELWVSYAQRQIKSASFCSSGISGTAGNSLCHLCIAVGISNTWSDFSASQMNSISIAILQPEFYSIDHAFWHCWIGHLSMSPMLHWLLNASNCWPSSNWSQIRYLLLQLIFAGSNASKYRPTISYPQWLRTASISWNPAC